MVTCIDCNGPGPVRYCRDCLAPVCEECGQGLPMRCERCHELVHADSDAADAEIDAGRIG